MRMNLAAFAEPGARGAHHARFLEQHVEEGPGVGLAVDPDVGRVVPAGARVPETGHFLANECGVAEVVVGQGPDLGFAVTAVDGLGRLLDGVGNPVEFRRVPPGPQRVQGVRLAAGRPGHAGFGHDRVGAPRSGESRRLGEAPELERDLAGAVDLVDGPGQGVVPDERLVGRVEQQEGLVLPGVVDPGFELGPGDGRAGGVVGEAQVDQVHRLPGGGGDEGVVPGRLQVEDAVVPAPVVRARAPRHHVRVQIHRVDRVGDGDTVVEGEDLLDVAGVAFRPVADEDLVGVDLGPPGLEILPGDRFAQKAVPLFGAVPAEGLRSGHFVHRPVQRLDAGPGQRAGDVADPQFDDLAAGAGRLERGDPPGDLREQVGRLEFQVMLVDMDHVRPPVGLTGAADRPPPPL